MLAQGSFRRGRRMKLKRTAADKWFSNCIRIAQNWTCEHCGRNYENNRQGLDCSHFYGRANYSVRFYPLNAFAHCMGCHRELGENPALFVEFVEKQLGQHGAEIIRSMSTDTSIGRAARKADKDGSLSKHYREQFRIMEAKREGGDMSVLTFEAWMPEELAMQFANRWALDNIS